MVFVFSPLLQTLVMLSHTIQRSAVALINVCLLHTSEPSEPWLDTNTAFICGHGEHKCTDSSLSSSVWFFKFHNYFKYLDENLLRSLMVCFSSSFICTVLEMKFCSIESEFEESLAALSAINTRDLVPLAAIHVHAITLPPPCLADVFYEVCLGSSAVFLLWSFRAFSVAKLISSFISRLLFWPLLKFLLSLIGCFFSLTMTCLHLHWQLFGPHLKLDWKPLNQIQIRLLHFDIK